MEGIREPPRRVQLLFDHFVTKEQRLRWARGIMVSIHANSKTVGEFFHDICDRFGLRCTSRHGPIFELNGYSVHRLEPTAIFRDLDKLIVEGNFITTRKKKAVATEKKKKVVRMTPIPEETGLEREQKEVEILTSPKNKQVASINDSTSTGFCCGPKEKMSLTATLNSAWEANGEAANVNGWDAWEPNH